MQKLSNPFSGLGQFCMHLGNELAGLEHQHEKLTYYLPESHLNEFGESVSYIKSRSLHKFFPLNSKPFDIWHCLHQDSPYLPGKPGTKLILTIHDLNFLEKYDTAKIQKRIRSLQKKVDRAEVITVISKYTEKIIRENLMIRDKPVHVIYNGNALKKTATAETNRFNNTNYFFSIGIIAEKKNFHVLIPLLEHFKDMQLIIAGNKSGEYVQKITAIARELHVEDRLHLVGNITESEKYWLYENCKAFLFPSVAEGFGLPVVEAMSLGKPVFLSKLTSLPEVGGEKAFYFGSFEKHEMIRNIEDGLAQYAAKPELKHEITAWAEQFSWSNAARSYLNLYKSM